MQCIPSSYVRRLCRTHAHSYMEPGEQGQSVRQDYLLVPLPRVGVRVCEGRAGCPAKHQPRPQPPGVAEGLGCRRRCLRLAMEQGRGSRQAGSQVGGQGGRRDGRALALHLEVDRSVQLFQLQCADSWACLHRRPCIRGLAVWRAVRFCEAFVVHLSDFVTTGSDFVMSVWDGFGQSTHRSS